MKMFRNIIKPNEKVRVRYLVSFAVWFALAALYIHRGNVSVAILEMVNRKTTTLPSQCYTYDPSKHPDNKNKTAKFDWDDGVQADILGSFFYGYAASHFVGGLMAARYGAKLTICISLLGSSLFNILTPQFAKLGSPAVIAARVGSGFFSGPIYPITHEIVGRWSAQEERTTLTMAIHTGNMAGSMINFGIGGVISQIQPNGWELFFYTTGAIGLLALILCLFLVFNNPEEHPHICESEIDFITKRKQPEAQHAQKKKHVPFKEVPFKGIFTSIPVYSVICAHFASNFLLYALLTGFPKYLSQVYGISTALSSGLSVVPFVVGFLVKLGWPFIVDYLIKKKGYDVTKVRKACGMVGATLASLSIMAAGTLPCERMESSIILICLSMCFYAVNISGYMTSIVDMGPRYAAIVMGIANTVASFGGFANPRIAAYLLKGRDRKIGWMYAHIMTGAVTFVLSIPFMIFGSSKLQPWAVQADKSPQRKLSTESALQKL